MLGELAGYVGVVWGLALALALQARWIRGDGWVYPASNLVIANLYLVSLLYQWNAPVAVSEFLWIALCLWGLARYWLARKKDKWKSSRPMTTLSTPTT